MDVAASFRVTSSAIVAFATAAGTFVVELKATSFVTEAAASAAVGVHHQVGYRIVKAAAMSTTMVDSNYYYFSCHTYYLPTLL